MAYQIFKPISQVQGLLFDMEGVILDAEGLCTRFWQEADLSVGYSMTLGTGVRLRPNWKAILARALTISRCGTSGSS